MTEVGLKGVYYGEEKTVRNYAGGSNAQSSLIQFLDILLGVKHYSTGERPLPFKASTGVGAENGFMNEMRKYIPGNHQNSCQKSGNHQHKPVCFGPQRFSSRIGIVIRCMSCHVETV